MSKTENKTVYQMIAEVAGKMAQEGVAKTRRNKDQGWDYRGIDEIYNALAPVMSSVGLVVLPRVISRECVERVSKNGGALFYTTVAVEFDFVSSHDGSKHTVVTHGEAMAFDDKSTNKAMSAAYKYACFQSFCIPIKGENDADAESHQVMPKQNVEAKPAPKVEQKPKAEEHPLLNDARKLIADIGKAAEIHDVRAMANANKDLIEQMRTINQKAYESINAKIAYREIVYAINTCKDAAQIEDYMKDCVDDMKLIGKLYKNDIEKIENLIEARREFFLGLS